MLKICRTSSVSLGLKLAAVAVLASACSATTASPPATTTAQANTTIPPPGTHVSLTVTPERARRQLQASTPGAQAIVASTATALGLKPTEAACVAQRLDTDPALRDALTDNPATSPRFGDLAAISQECIRTTTGATNFANSIAAQAGGTLPTETLDCLRDAWANLTAEQTGNLTQAALNPGTTDPAARDTVNGLLDGCHVDRNKLVTPPR